MSKTLEIVKEPIVEWDEKECLSNIRQKSQVARDSAAECVSIARSAVYAAIECGSWLNLARIHIPHGVWLEWCRTNVSYISQDTIHRYMLLSNRYLTHVQNGEELPFQTLRQAYLIAGIVQEKSKTEPEAQLDAPSHQSIPATLSSVLMPFVRWKHKVFEKSLSDATGAQLEQWEQELREPYEAYVEVQKRLGR